jgi:cytochrome c556
MNLANRPFATTFLAGIACAALAACGGTADETAVAEADAPPVIKERQDNLEEVGDSFKAIMDSLKSGTPELAMIADKAQIINTNAGKITGHFPEGTSIADGYDTEALPAIWEKPAEFSSAAERLVGASADLVAAAQSGDAAATGEAAKAMGGACKNCHDQFREKDD